MMKKLFVMGVLGLACVTAQAASKTANCEIRIGGESHKGKCRFTSEGGGSFTISHSRVVNELDAESVYVDVYATGQATATVTFKDGQSVFWGHFRRSNSDRACWVSTEKRDGLTICAR